MVIVYFSPLLYYVLWSINITVFYNIVCNVEKKKQHMANNTVIIRTKNVSTAVTGKILKMSTENSLIQTTNNRLKQRTHDCASNIKKWLLKVVKEQQKHSNKHQEVNTVNATIAANYSWNVCCIINWLICTLATQHDVKP